MKHKYRIVEKVDIANEIVFIPQYKKYFMWWNFMQMDVFPKFITFYTLDSAKRFIQSQLDKPEDKHHYF